MGCDGPGRPSGLPLVRDPYQLIDVSGAGMPSLEFSLRLLEECGVTVAPGSVFGPLGEGFVRISFAASTEAIEEGIARIGRAVQSWG